VEGGREGGREGGTEGGRDVRGVYVGETRGGKLGLHNGPHKEAAAPDQILLEELGHNVGQIRDVDLSRGGREGRRERGRKGEKEGGTTRGKYSGLHVGLMAVKDTTWQQTACPFPRSLKFTPSLASSLSLPPSLPPSFPPHLVDQAIDGLPERLPSHALVILGGLVLIRREKGRREGGREGAW